MSSRPQAFLAAALCGLALVAAPVEAQAPAAPASSAAAPAPLPKTLPLRRDDPAAPASAPAWLAGALLLAVLGAAAVAVARRQGALGARWRRTGRGGAAPITRLSSQPLTPQASVHAIQWNGEELLLACTPQQVTVLARRPVPSAREAA